ncbi:MAG: biopolymer transporter ExbD [Gammaproteobacteria bacterium]|nr:biopolymer transporter ExbD [Gammaproteobacteria bacterium]
MKKFDNINVIPFIDIMLVLLAIVLTTATFVTSGHLDIDLPEAKSEASSSEQEMVEIAIDRDQQYYLAGAKIALNELETRLTRIATDSRIMLRVDESVPFNQFVTVVDLLQQLSLENVSIQTRPGAGGSAANSAPEAVPVNSQ